MNIRKRASDLWTSLRYDGVHTDMSDTRKHVDRIAEALAAVERETLEQAAKEADADGAVALANALRIMACDVSIQVNQAGLTAPEVAPVASNSGLNGGRERADSPGQTASKVCSAHGTEKMDGCLECHPKASTTQTVEQGGWVSGEYEHLEREKARMLAAQAPAAAVTCERCEDYDKILEQYAEGAGKTISQLRKALKEARDAAPAVCAACGYPNADPEGYSSPMMLRALKAEARIKELEAKVRLEIGRRTLAETARPDSQPKE